MKRSILISLVLLLCASADALAMMGAVQGSPTPAWREGEILVKFRPDSRMAEVTGSRGDLTAMASALGVSRARKLRSGHVAPGLYSLKLKAGDSVEAAVAAFSQDPDVEYAQPDYAYHATLTPNDPSFGQLWGLNNTGQTVNGTQGVPGSDIMAVAAWDKTTGSADVVVCVMDTGIDYDHPDLAGNVWTNPGEIPGNWTDDDGNGYVDDVHGINAITGSGDPRDDAGHGTHVSGIIGAVGDNGQGVAGVNWATRIMAVKFLNASGGGYTSDAVECMDYVVMMKKRGVDVRVLNASWGAPRDDTTLKAAVKNVCDNGILFVAAAGNIGADIDSQPFMPATINLPGLMAVASTDSSDRLAYFSNYGLKTVHVAAPGVNILSTVATLGYEYHSGTSMAAPHVSGLAALVLSAEPELSAAALKGLIMSSVDAIPGLPVVSGGRINAARALDNELDLTVRQDGAYTVMQASLRIGGAVRPGKVVAFYQDGIQVGKTKTGSAGSASPGVAVRRFRGTLGDNHTGGATYTEKGWTGPLRSAGLVYDTRPPLITQLAPAHGVPGSTVTVTGTNFGSRRGQVRLAGSQSFSVRANSWSDSGGSSSLTFAVPRLNPGVYQLTVSNRLAVSQPVSFTIDAAP